MLLRDEEITNLYVTTVKRPAEYFELYQVLPLTQSARLGGTASECS